MTGGGGKEPLGEVGCALVVVTTGELRLERVGVGLVSTELVAVDLGCVDRLTGDASGAEKVTARW